MTYDLWDVEIGKQVGSFATEAEALRLARMLIDAYGDDYAEDLELVGDDDSRPNLTGAALVERVRRLASLGEPAQG